MHLLPKLFCMCIVKNELQLNHIRKIILNFQSLDNYYERHTFSVCRNGVIALNGAIAFVAILLKPIDIITVDRYFILIYLCNLVFRMMRKYSIYWVRSARFCSIFHSFLPLPLLFDIFQSMISSPRFITQLQKWLFFFYFF